MLPSLFSQPLAAPLAQQMTSVYVGRRVVFIFLFCRELQILTSNRWDKECTSFAAQLGGKVSPQ